MHALAIIILPKDIPIEKIQTHVENVMEKYYEHNWDWYVIGGRWDGVITDHPQESENGFNFTPQHHTIENNLAPCKYLLEKKHTCCSIIDPEGGWTENPDAWVDKGKHDWKKTCFKYWQKYKDHLAVGVDYHN